MHPSYAGHRPSRSTSISAAWPPPLPNGETEETKTQRIRLEQDAKRISEAIDRDIDKDREARRQDSKATRVIFLGQSESGKSTLLKNFRLQFSPKAFEAELLAWRPIILLNLVRSINYILEVLRTGAEKSGTTSTITERAKTPPAPTTDSSLRRLQISLTPLKSVEEVLARKVTSIPPPVSTTVREPSKAAILWKGIRAAKGSKDEDGNALSSEQVQDQQVSQIMHACSSDMANLWADPVVQSSLRARLIVLEDQPGFFLDDVKRISALEYKPTSDDVLRARVMTEGVEEHHIPMETSLENGEKWIIYDVGGSSKQRAAWAPFFDAVSVLVFIAPISAFDQNLAEIPTTNRLADSFTLWEGICSNKILSTVQFILLLNKVDLLHAKLRTGSMFNRYVTSYKDRPNDTASVTKYLSDKFHALHLHASPIKRKLYIHLTCAIDTTAMTSVLSEIRDVVIKKNLQQTSIL